MKMVIKYLKPYFGIMSIGLLIKIIGTFMDLAIPYLLTHIVDNVIKKNDINLVLLYGLLMVVCALIGFINNVVAIFFI